MKKGEVGWRGGGGKGGGEGRGKGGKRGVLEKGIWEHIQTN